MSVIQSAELYACVYVCDCCIHSTLTHSCTHAQRSGAESCGCIQIFARIGINKHRTMSSCSADTERKSERIEWKRIDFDKIVHLCFFPSCLFCVCCLTTDRPSSLLLFFKMNSACVCVCVCVFTIGFVCFVCIFSVSCFLLVLSDHCCYSFNWIGRACECHHTTTVYRISCVHWKRKMKITLVCDSFIPISQSVSLVLPNASFFIGFTTMHCDNWTLMRTIKSNTNALDNMYQSLIDQN